MTVQHSLSPEEQRSLCPLRLPCTSTLLQAMISQHLMSHLTCMPSEEHRRYDDPRPSQVTSRVG